MAVPRRDHWRGVPADPAYLVPDAVDHGLPEVGLHGADVPRLEPIQATHHLQNGFLDEITGVERVARGGRQPAVRPPPQ